MVLDLDEGSKDDGRFEVKELKLFEVNVLLRNLLSSLFLTSIPHRQLESLLDLALQKKVLPPNLLSNVAES